MASDFRKPDRVHTLWRDEIQDKMWSLPVEQLFFAGKATCRKLKNLGIRTIGELACTDPGILKAHMKKHGEVIWKFANGLDFSVVESVPAANKGYGNSTTIAFDVTDVSTARLVLLALAETVGSRLREAGVRAEVVAIGIRTRDLKHSGCQMILPDATNITSEIHDYACRLFDRLWDGTPIRHLGIRTGRLETGGDMRQLDLFDRTDYSKLERRDAAVDQIRHRFGIDAVKRASFLKSPIDHMSGGVSREKRTVDYGKLEIR